jgi:hypothetical protein
MQLTRSVLQSTTVTQDEPMDSSKPARRRGVSDPSSSARVLLPNPLRSMLSPKRLSKYTGNLLELRQGCNTSLLGELAGVSTSSPRMVFSLNFCRETTEAVKDIELLSTAGYSVEANQNLKALFNFEQTYRTNRPIQNPNQDHTHEGNCSGEGRKSSPHGAAVSRRFYHTVRPDHLAQCCKCASPAVRCSANELWYHFCQNWLFALTSQ